MLGSGRIPHDRDKGEAEGLAGAEEYVGKSRSRAFFVSFWEGSCFFPQRARGGSMIKVKSLFSILRSQSTDNSK